MKDKLINGLNMLLVADVFFVFLAFGWFAIAILGRSLGFPLGLDIWYALWQPVFNPAIGILILGALLSGLISWMSERLKRLSSN